MTRIRATEKRITDKRRNGKAKIPRRTESSRKEDNMTKFKVGDRVKIVRNDYLTCEIGDTGTIRAYDSGAGYAVEFDIPRYSYHGCRGLTKPGCGYWAWEKNIELIKPTEEKPTREFKLIITSKGDTTTAKLIHGKDVEKEATVSRYSKDEYSEKAAVEAVTKKIFGEGEKKTEKKDELFNGVAVCLIDRDCPKFTRGRTYTFVNGNCWNDKGNVMAYGYTKKEIANSIWFLPIME